MSNRKLALALLTLAIAASGPAQALFKVVGPDGKITYTDRPPPNDAGRVSPIGERRAAPVQANLPAELRVVATKFPVTLYTAPECAPCDEARALLRARGVPFAERIASTNADREAWINLLGGNAAPALRVGGKSLLGLSPDEWNSYLDAAGYPRNSTLPPDYAYPPAEPLVPRVAPTPAPAPAPQAPPATEAAPPAPGGLRF